MKRKLLRQIVLGSLLAFFCYSCNLEFFDNAEFQENFTWNPSLAIPVGEITYTVSELFQELNDPNVAIVSNSENVVTLLFVEELEAQRASEFLTVDSQGFEGNVNSGIDTPNSPVATVLNVSESFQYDLTLSGQERLDSILFSGGNFTVELSTTIDPNVDFTLTIPSLVNKTTGLPLVVTGSLTQASPTFNSDDLLSDYKGVFTDDGSGGVTSNSVIVELEYEIFVEVGDNLNASDEVRFDVSFTDPEFDRIFGNVGNDELDLSSQTVELDFFSSFENGTIRFADPQFSFRFENSFGFPMGVDFQNVTARNSDGVELALSGPVTEAVQIIDAPTVEQIGQSVRSEIVLNTDNSNIDDLMSHKPIEMTFDVSAITNPPTGPSQYNFLGVDDFLDVDIEVEIPLDIGLDELSAEQTMNFDNGSDLEEVKSLMLRLIVDNGIPMGGTVEMVFRNGSTPVYTITDRPLFSAAPVDGNGRVTENVQTVTDVLLDEDAINAMENATSILVIATVSTTGVGSGQEVKLFSDYEMNIRVAMQADLSISSNGN